MKYEFTNRPMDPVSTVDGFPDRISFERRTRSERDSGIAEFHPYRGPSGDHDANYREASPATLDAWQAWQDANAEGRSLVAERDRLARATRVLTAKIADTEREPQPEDDHELRVLRRQLQAAASRVQENGRAALRALREYDRLVIEAQVRGDLRPTAWEKTIEADDAARAAWAAFRAAFDERERQWRMAGAPGAARHWERFGGSTGWSGGIAGVETTLANFPNLRDMTPESAEKEREAARSFRASAARGIA